MTAVSLILGSRPSSHPDVRPGLCEPVQVWDPLAAHHHCKVTRWPDGSMSMTDLETYQGTWIKRRGATIWQRIPSGGTRVLCPGDVVRIGSTEIPYGSAEPPWYYVP